MSAWLDQPGLTTVRSLARWEGDCEAGFGICGFADTRVESSLFFVRSDGSASEILEISLLPLYLVRTLHDSGSDGTYTRLLSTKWI